MRNNPLLLIAVFSAIILLIDFYTFRGVKKLIAELTSSVKRIITLTFWILPILIITGLIFIVVFQKRIPAARFTAYFHLLSGSFVLFYVPKLVFILFNFFDDVILLVKKILKSKRKSASTSNKNISRRKFLNQVGVIFAGIPFISIFYGIAYGRFDFTIRKVKLKLKNLPEKFDGLRIVQLSDFHLGSFVNHKEKIDEVIKIANDLNPDLLLFTGDLVNNVSKEVDKFHSSLSNLKAKLGKYSILGNHDYGEYVRWDSEKAKKDNLERLKNLQKEVGFDLLLNESRVIKIGDKQICLIGVENWGLPPFPQYGDLDKALENVDDSDFKILMTHDPTHWDEQVLGKTNVDLSLSGHTHGAQFGIEIPGWRWSPVNLRYKRWGGLYSEGKQHLYVNTGIGFIGFPGRVGMPPEITLIELKKKR